MKKKILSCFAVILVVIISVTACSKLPWASGTAELPQIETEGAPKTLNEYIEEKEGDTEEEAQDQGSGNYGLNHGESGYVIEDGMTQPILEYSYFRDSDYTNEGSDILRFCVYVETDNDTDNDGMADLVKVFAQVPTAAVRGYYKAAVIYDPTPYNVGMAADFSLNNIEDSNTAFDYNLLYKDCDKRSPGGEISTYDLAMKSNPSQWNYYISSSGYYGYGCANDYDYYLIRGYAVIEASGLGTLGSEGYEVCSMDLEALAHKCVVEWLTGERMAYSDPEGKNVVKADWCNGNVAMTGYSYGGTLPFEVATLGVKGLKTIIPIAGASNWYTFANSQGVSKNDEDRSSYNLAGYNSGSLYLDDDWTVLDRDFASLLHQIAADQKEANGNYTDIWKNSDYTTRYENIDCSALIVQGLNDDTVSTIEADGMYQAFKKAGKTAKIIFHQGGHAGLDGIKVGSVLWQEGLNRWLSYYLLDVDNGADGLSEVSYQSNTDGQFYKSESWGDAGYIKAEARYEGKTATVTTEGYRDEVTSYFSKNNNSRDESVLDEAFFCLPDTYKASYDLNIENGTTVYGTPRVSLKAAPTVGGIKGAQITAVLLDVIDEQQDFPAYMTKQKVPGGVPVSTVGTVDSGGIGDISVKEYVKSYTKAKVVTSGWMDLANPGGGSDLSDYAWDWDIEAKKEYDYTFYMMPTVYTLEPGHTLRLVLTTCDPRNEALLEDYDLAEYGYVINNESLDIEIPVLSE